jgi:predicted choloylglycine hydrolase
MKRREFLITASGALVGLTLSSSVGCGRREIGELPPEGAKSAFPFLEVSGNPYEVGLAIGRRFEGQIREGLQRRADWFNELRSFMEGDPASRYEPFVAAAREHFPEILEELRGWADGSGLAFEDLMVLNLKAELSTLMQIEAPESPGCSTIAFSHAGRCLLAHNEDGHGAYSDLMFLVRVSRPDKPDFLCLTYPGILSGNGPAMNEAGIVLTTNYIGGLDVRRGIPRYVISRAVLDAGSLDEAVAIVTHPERAFSFHYNLGSRSEGKILSVETSVNDAEVHEVDGLYVHTNHFRLPGMEQIRQDEDYVATSSMSRYGVLATAADGLRDRLDDVDREALIGWLSSHDRAPYSPCRHPTNDVTGATLGSAFFDIGAGDLRLYDSNPCRGSFADFGRGQVFRDSVSGQDLTPSDLEGPGQGDVDRGGRQTRGGKDCPVPQAGRPLIPIAEHADPHRGHGRGDRSHEDPEQRVGPGGEAELLAHFHPENSEIGDELGNAGD